MFLFRFRRGHSRLAPERACARTSDGTAVPLDVREPSEWRAGHAPGAVHLPLTRLLAGATRPATVRGRPVVAIRRSGRRAQQTAELPVFRGIDAVDVSGGMTAWVRAGLPVTDEGGQGGRIA
ncbi:rhodanese-like domain-containing protein [Streptomyces yatensis]|uniref:Rhodanese domain-containing protein n=1 Tax=Streptomyces yatensis TaxID=155177 RepID=A0ABN2GKZ2_9ACTN|nr:rhodanese-like domain-containing protein [Streptomyces yatensis]